MSHCEGLNLLVVFWIRYLTLGFQGYVSTDSTPAQGNKHSGSQIYTRVIGVNQFICNLGQPN